MSRKGNSEISEMVGKLLAKKEQECSSLYKEMVALSEVRRDAEADYLAQKRNDCPVFDWAKNNELDAKSELIWEFRNELLDIKEALDGHPEPLMEATLDKNEISAFQRNSAARHIVRSIRLSSFLAVAFILAGVLIPSLRVWMFELAAWPLIYLVYLRYQRKTSQDPSAATGR